MRPETACIWAVAVPTGSIRGEHSNRYEVPGGSVLFQDIAEKRNGRKELSTTSLPWSHSFAAMENPGGGAGIRHTA